MKPSIPWWYKAVLAMEKRVNSLLNKSKRLRQLADLLRKIPFRIGMLIFLSNFLFYALFLCSGAFLRPIKVGLAVAAVCWTLSKITRYVGFIIVGKEGFLRMKAHFERQDKGKKEDNKKKS